jgi:hypothetical protein
MDGIGGQGKRGTSAYLIVHFDVKPLTWVEHGVGSGSGPDFTRVLQWTRVGHEGGPNYGEPLVTVRAAWLWHGEIQDPSPCWLCDTYVNSPGAGDADRLAS